MLEIAQHALQEGVLHPVNFGLVLLHFSTEITAVSFLNQLFRTQISQHSSPIWRSLGSSVKLPAQLTVAFNGEEDRREQVKCVHEVKAAHGFTHAAGFGGWCRTPVLPTWVIWTHTTVCASVKTCHKLRTAQRR